MSHSLQEGSTYEVVIDNGGTEQIRVWPPEGDKPVSFNEAAGKVVELQEKYGKLVLRRVPGLELLERGPAPREP